MQGRPMIRRSLFRSVGFLSVGCWSSLVPLVPYPGNITIALERYECAFVVF